MSPDLIAGIVAFLFTLMIFSYLIGDNPLFRVAVHIFVGASAGYVAAVAFRQVIWLRLVAPMMNGSPSQQALLAVPLLLSGLLLMKALPSLGRLGSPAVALMAGAGAAVAVGGAVTGTLFPQIGATINAFQSPAPLQFLNALIVLIGIVFTLIYFHFSARAAADGSVRRFGLIEIAAFIGSIFIAITLGVLFAGVYSAALAAFIERLRFLGTFFGLG